MNHSCLTAPTTYDDDDDDKDMHERTGIYTIYYTIFVICHVCMRNGHTSQVAIYLVIQYDFDKIIDYREKWTGYSMCRPHRLPTTLLIFKCFQSFSLWRSFKTKKNYTIPAADDDDDDHLFVYRATCTIHFVCTRAARNTIFN